jgi:hypothetical protein
VELDWEEVSGRGDPKQRFRIYRLHSTDDDPYLLATCESEQAVGVTICEIAREGQLQDAAVGILDTMGEKGQRWLVNPFAPARQAR